MSKCLTEEAMTYFDECVSLSTFDSSDFSAQEDPPELAIVVTPMSSHNSSNSCSLNPSSLHGSSIEQCQNSQFPFAHEVTVSLDQGMRNYIKTCENTTENGADLEIERSDFYYADEYTLRGQAESILLDIVLLKKGVESGSLILCGGGSAVPFLPFASIM